MLASRDSTGLNSVSLVRRRSHIATDGQPVSKSWCRAPSGGHDQIYITIWQLRSCFCLLLALSQRSLSRIRVPWDSRPYFTVSDLRLPFFFTLSLVSKSKSKSHCDWRSVSQLVLVSSHIWGLWPDIFSVRNTEYVWQLRSSFRGTPSLTRGLATVFYCLRFETSLFVASYDSQGHGGGIRPRLHTGLNEFLSARLLI
jgi:hypothetical protein